MQPTIQQLQSQVNDLREQVTYLESVFKMMGLPIGRWITINEAARLFQRSRGAIVSEISKAEDARLSGRKPTLTYGKHYRNDQSIDSTQPTWKINISEYGNYLSIPPEERQ